MKIFAIGDLHLPGNSEKPMDIFGWQDHKEKIFASWKEQVSTEDLVLLCGDTSWAMKMEDAQEDLQAIASLPGQKFLIRGNHDYWWGTQSQLSLRFPELHFVHNNHFSVGNYQICGTRGWTCPGPGFSEEDQKIYLREQRRLRMSFEAIKEEGKEILAMIHYPPTNEQKEDSAFTAIFEEFGVKDVVYGHLHGSKAHQSAFEGIRNGVQYHLVACDYLQFQLKQIR